MADRLHQSFLSLLLFFFIFFTSIDAQSYDSSHYPNCPSYECNGLPIRYPFWKIGDQTTTQFCGYQGLGINCSRHNDTIDVPTITMGGELYYVREIPYGTESIVLVDFDVSDAVAVVADCPRVRHNIDLETLPFDFMEGNLNLSFRFNCTQIPPFARLIPCLSRYPGRRSCVYNLSSEIEPFNWECEEEVETTVFGSVVGLYPLEMVFGQALSRGFELKWRTSENCRNCEGSGGRCGYNVNTTELLCFCPDGTTTTDHCRKGSKINLTGRLFLVVGSALISAVLIFIIYCIIKSSRGNCVALFKHKTEDDISVEAFIMQYGSLATQQ